jgi:ATP-dependent RNA helicase DeaD
MANTFQDLGLSKKIISAISELGFEKPTPVQETVIPVLLNEKRDLVCLAQTGTGKTAAFGLPMIQKIDFSDKNVQGLILSPTRELCRQITEDIKNYSKLYDNLQVVAVYGGSSIEAQVRALKKGAQIIVATPGRMVDLIERGAAHVDGIKTLVLDEADEMLNMGFKDELDFILATTPADRQTLLFSATLPMEVEGIAKHYMHKPEIITVGVRNSGASNVKHYYFVVHAKDRYNALKRIADYNPDIYGIVFCRTRQETQEVADMLMKDGYNADSLHGELSQNQRDQVMSRFKAKTLSILVATDVAARGIDVNDLTHVINYNLPDEAEVYTHRSGRTGRADKNGVSVIIINAKEQNKIKTIEKLIGKTISRAKIPTATEVCSKQLLHLVQEIENVEVKEEILEYTDLVYEKWKDLSKEEIIQKVLSAEFNRFLDYYRHAPDLNVQAEESRKGDREGYSNATAQKVEKGYKWVKMNVGFRQNVTTRHLLRLASSLGIGKKSVGKIDLRKEVTFIAISSSAAQFFADEMNNMEYRGNRLRAEVVND